MIGKVNSVSGDNIKFIEKEYDSATVYNEGDTASIRGVLYSCLVNNTTGTLNMDRWKRVYLSDLAEVTSSEQALVDMVDEVYDPSKTYNKGDTALYNEVLYVCKNDGTTGKWNADLWEQTTLVSILNSNLDVEISNLLTTADSSKFSIDYCKAYRTGHIVDFYARVYIANEINMWTDIANISIPANYYTIIRARNESNKQIYSTIAYSTLKAEETMPGGWYQIQGTYII